MQSDTNAISHPMPSDHVESLARIESGYWWYEGRVYWASQLIKEALSRKENSAHTFADIGCGTGGFATALREKFPFSRGLLVDGDPAVLKLAGRFQGFEVLKTDLEGDLKLPWKPSVITCMDVLEHLKQDKKLVTTVAKILPPNGIFVASVPAHPFLYSEWDRQLGHYRRYTKKTLTALFADSGLKIKSMRYMWSFLTPAAPIRKLRSRRYQTNMDFEKTNPMVNSLLIMGSRWEYLFASFFPTPFGTSLIVSAEKI